MQLNITSNLEEFVVGWLMIWVMVRGHLPFPLPGLSSTSKKTLEKESNFSFLVYYQLDKIISMDVVEHCFHQLLLESLIMMNIDFWSKSFKKRE